MLDTKYNHLDVEKDKYENWKEKGYFKCGDTSKEPFTIILPPPNVTGKLHLGHAWDVSLQDIMARYKRMDGYDVLWLPGTDHAAIATESKVVKKLKSEGINKYDLGREKFLEACWDWTREYGGNIRKEWAHMGCSLDYSKERFTLDEYSVKAVNKVFIEMYKKGLIYKGKRIINWDPEAKTALSNEEVIYKDTKGAFYHIKYFIEGTNDYLDVATTRPETLFGDTAVAVNPKDDRYKDLIGKNVIVPIVDRVVPIIGDIHADIDKGTGVVKITPAHDPNDFEVGNRHNLERIVIMDETAHMNEETGKYNGLDRFECRDKLLKELEEKDLLIGIEEITHSVGYSERTDVMVEPYLSEQWFVKMEGLAKDLINMQQDKDNKVNFYPKRYEKTIIQKAEECYDWCISRQLWWGIRIPIWYKNDEIKASVESPGEGWVQDKDVLDTWFSSALWPFSTLGWAMEDKSLFERYYPTNFMSTGYDILFFWVYRMMFQGEQFTGKNPFKDCYMHGLIRAKDGRKMSKSLGNGVEPIEMVEKYGADALRFYLTTSSAPGLDLRFDEEKLSATWNFINKIWNASRFTLMNIEDIKEINLDNLSFSDKWILTKYNDTVKIVRKNMDKYEFQNVGTELYNFIWSDFCDFYIEASKFDIDNEGTKSTLLYVLTGILKMLHPFMPFVTEEIYQMLPVKSAESIMISNYPKYEKKLVFSDTLELMNSIRDFITKARISKKDNNIKKDCKYTFRCSTDQKIENLICDMLKLTKENIAYQEEIDTFESISVDYDNHIFNANLVFYFEVSSEDKAKEQESLLKQKEVLESQIARREKLLSNQGYVNNAPKELVEEERTKLDNEKKELELINLKLKD
ncbi:MAG: valine--tRNA ligase [Bacilli bacterium]|nr:valine--tRNA ligase [Bacilli bacterium]